MSDQRTPLPVVDGGGPGGERCDRCRFWEEAYPKGGYEQSDIGDWSWGFCHRSPPVFRGGGVSGTDPMHTYHTPTYHDDWCGEFRPRPEADTP